MTTSTSSQDEAHPPYTNGSLRSRPSVGDVLRLPRHEHLRLPPKDEAVKIVTSYFNGPNNALPLFHPGSFMQRFHRQYGREYINDPAWWAASNVVMALALRLHSVPGLAHEEQDKRAQQYLQNALTVVSDLTLYESSLLAIQALLGIVLLLQGIPDPRPGSVFLAAAIRLSNHLGMHRKGSPHDLDIFAATQRKRVFWIAALLDKDFSIRTEQPQMIDNDDVDIDLPEISPQDGLGYVYALDSFTKINYFRLRVELSIIQGKAYRNLYSARASKNDVDTQLLTVYELHQSLVDWKVGIDPRFWAENIATSVPKALMMQMIFLHLAYFHCLATVHRVTFQNRLWQLAVMVPPGPDGKLVPDDGEWCQSAETCEGAARSSVQLMAILPMEEHPCIWIMMSYCVSAMVILMARIIHKPTHVEAHSDLALIKPQLQLLYSLAERADDEGFERMRGICVELERKCEAALETTVKIPNSIASLEDRQSANIVLGTDTLGIHANEFQGYNFPPWDSPMTNLDLLNKENPLSSVQLDDWSGVFADNVQHALEMPGLETPFLDMGESFL
ncbi:hypothetical protein BU16DRAFT_472187 [Lophium mytilinum]|uniref:Xylanolytic transcriptional activator regulatory domain-containing protein n=1 Tax=Lophium mytilinum TaxID=390894 RepID=A0A6A6QAU3_9PEZI|nr:hypothetical protein BU16DRAFT_472187 [Lophium mytilinum]